MKMCLSVWGCRKRANMGSARRRAHRTPRAGATPEGCSRQAGKAANLWPPSAEADTPKLAAQMDMTSIGATAQFIIDAGHELSP